MKKQCVKNPMALLVAAAMVFPFAGNFAAPVEKVSADEGTALSNGIGVYLKAGAPAGGNGTLNNPYNDLNTAINNVPGGGTIGLLNDYTYYGVNRITISKAFTIASYDEVTGYNITNESQYHSLIRGGADAQLCIGDPADNDKKTSTKTTNVTLKHIILDGQNIASGKNAITVKSKQFYWFDWGNKYSYFKGTLTFAEGSIMQNYYQTGGYMVTSEGYDGDTWSSCYIKAGSVFRNNTSTTTAFFNVGTGNTLEMSGGTVTNNTYNKICNMSDDKGSPRFYLTGGTFTQNTISYYAVDFNGGWTRIGGSRGGLQSPLIIKNNHTSTGAMVNLAKDTSNNFYGPLVAGSEIAVWGSADTGVTNKGTGLDSSTLTVYSDKTLVNGAVVNGGNIEFIYDPRTNIVGVANGDKNTSITLNRTKTNLKYALCDTNGNRIGEWISGNGEDISFDGLGFNTKYYVVAIYNDPKYNPVSGLTGSAYYDRIGVYTPNYNPGVTERKPVAEASYDTFKFTPIDGYKYQLTILDSDSDPDEEGAAKTGTWSWKTVAELRKTSTNWVYNTDGSVSVINLNKSYSYVLTMIQNVTNTDWCFSSSTAITTIGRKAIVYVQAGKSGDGTEWSKPMSSLADAYALVANNGEIRIIGDVQLTKRFYAFDKKTVTITSYSDKEDKLATNPVTITRADSMTSAGFAGSLLYVTNGEIKLNNVILDGKAGIGGLQAGTKNTKAPLIAIDASGVVTLGNNTFLQNNRVTNGSASDSTDKSAAVFINGSATLNIDGGTIRYNQVTNTGDNSSSQSIVNAMGTGVTINLLKADVYGNYAQKGNIISTNVSLPKSQLKIKNCNITGNVVAPTSYIIRGFETTAPAGVIYIYGNTTDDGSNTNVTLQDGQTISLTGKPAAGSKIGINTKANPTLKNKASVKIVEGTSGGRTVTTAEVDMFLCDRTLGIGGIFIDGGSTQQPTGIYVSGVTDQVTGCDADSKGEDGNGKVSVTINNLLPEFVYTIADENGKMLQTSKWKWVNNIYKQVYTDYGWFSGSEGSLTFDSLDEREKYILVAIPVDGVKSTTGLNKKTDRIQFVSPPRSMTIGKNLSDIMNDKVKDFEIARKNYNATKDQITIRERGSIVFVTLGAYSTGNTVEYALYDESMNKVWGFERGPVAGDNKAQVKVDKTTDYYVSARLYGAGSDWYAIENFTLVEALNKGANYVCQYCGDDKKGSGTIDSPFKTVQTGYNKTGSGANLALLSDVDLGSTFLNLGLGASPFNANINKNVTITSVVSDSHNHKNQNAGRTYFNLQRKATDWYSFSNNTPAPIIKVTKGTLRLTNVGYDGSYSDDYKPNGGTTSSASAFLVTDKGKLIFDDGAVISGEHNKGYTINVLGAGSSLTIKDGAVITGIDTNNALINCGSGATVSMTGGTISGNSVNTLFNLGVNNNPTISITGGQIKENQVKTTAINLVNSVPNFTFGDSAYVYDNVIKNTATQANIFLGNESTRLFLSSALSDNAKLGVYSVAIPKEGSPAIIAVGATNNDGNEIYSVVAADADKIFSDKKYTAEKIYGADYNAKYSASLEKTAAVYVAWEERAIDPSREIMPEGQIEFVSDKIVGLNAGEDYIINGEKVTADASGAVAIKDAWTDGAVSIVKVGGRLSEITNDKNEKETIALKDSEAQVLYLAARPEAPNPSPVGDVQKMFNLDDTMEYKLVPDGTWTKVPTGATSVDGLQYGYYEVRYQSVQVTDEDGNTYGQLAGKSIQVKVYAPEGAIEATPDAALSGSENLGGFIVGEKYLINGVEYTAVEGKPIYQDKLDDQGNPIYIPVLDKDGKPVYEQAKDEDGNLLYETKTDIIGYNKTTDPDTGEEVDDLTDPIYGEVPDLTKPIKVQVFTDETEKDIIGYEGTIPVDPSWYGTTVSVVKIGEDGKTLDSFPLLLTIDPQTVDVPTAAVAGTMTKDGKTVDAITGLEAGKTYIINGITVVADANGAVPRQADWVGDVSIIKVGNGILADSEPFILKIAKDPEPAPTLVSADQSDFFLKNFEPNATYIINGYEYTANEDGIIAIDPSWSDTTITVAKKGTRLTADSEEVTIYIGYKKEAQPEPTVNVITKAFEDLQAEADYMITITLADGITITVPAMTSNSNGVIAFDGTYTLKADGTVVLTSETTVESGDTILTFDAIADGDAISIVKLGDVSFDEDGNIIKDTTTADSKAVTLTMPTKPLYLVQYFTALSPEEQEATGVYGTFNIPTEIQDKLLSELSNITADNYKAVEQLAQDYKLMDESQQALLPQELQDAFESAKAQVSEFNHKNDIADATFYKTVEVPVLDEDGNPVYELDAMGEPIMMEVVSVVRVIDEETGEEREEEVTTYEPLIKTQIITVKDDSQWSVKLIVEEITDAAEYSEVQNDVSAKAQSYTMIIPYHIYMQDTLTQKQVQPETGQKVALNLKSLNDNFDLTEATKVDIIHFLTGGKYEIITAEVLGSKTIAFETRSFSKFAIIAELPYEVPAEDEPEITDDTDTKGKTGGGSSSKGGNSAGKATTTPTTTTETPAQTPATETPVVEPVKPVENALVPWTAEIVATAEGTAHNAAVIAALSEIFASVAIEEVNEWDVTEDGVFDVLDLLAIERYLQDVEDNGNWEEIPERFTYENHDFGAMALIAGAKALATIEKTDIARHEEAGLTLIAKALDSNTGINAQAKAQTLAEIQVCILHLHGALETYDVTRNLITEIFEADNVLDDAIMQGWSSAEDFINAVQK
jgi:hypothetical protein